TGWTVRSDHRLDGTRSINGRQYQTRIMTSARKDPSVALWLTIILVVLVGYPLSFGPACWITSRADDRELPTAYLPIGWLLGNSPRLIVVAFIAYAQVGMPAGSHITIPAEGDIVSVIRR